MFTLAKKLGFLLLGALYGFGGLLYAAPEDVGTNSDAKSFIINALRSNESRIAGFVTEYDLQCELSDKLVAINVDLTAKNQGAFGFPGVKHIKWETDGNRVWASISSTVPTETNAPGKTLLMFNGSTTTIYDASTKNARILVGKELEIVHDPLIYGFRSGPGKSGKYWSEIVSNETCTISPDTKDGLSNATHILISILNKNSTRHDLILGRSPEFLIVAITNYSATGVAKEVSSYKWKEDAGGPVLESALITYFPSSANGDVWLKQFVHVKTVTFDISGLVDRADLTIPDGTRVVDLTTDNVYSKGASTNATTARPAMRIESKKEDKGFGWGWGLLALLILVAFVFFARRKRSG